MKQLNSTQYSIQVVLNVYCSSTTIPDSIGPSAHSSEARIFDKGNDTLITTITSGLADSILTIQYGDACYTPPGLCGKAYYYSTVVNLTSSSNGYYFTWKLNNRAPIINISSSRSYVFYASFSTSISFGNNTLPRFNKSKYKGYGCIGYTFPLDLSCTEPDGDSLVYSIVTPISDFTPTGSKPFNYSSYSHGISKPLGIGSFCTIDSTTGIVSGRLAQLGLYSLAVKCEEYRGGIKISEVIKDITFSGLN